MRQFFILEFPVYRAGESFIASMSDGRYMTDDLMMGQSEQWLH